MFNNDSNDVIIEIANELHGGWRRELTRGTQEVTLPDNLMEESMASARSAVYHALRGLNSGLTRERIAERIHEDWSMRNEVHGEKIAFSRLSHHEREREFTILETALRVLQRHRVI